MSVQRLQKMTIKDIARICNVSTQTVSRVLNKRPDVAQSTRAAVEKAIADLGYQPSALARSLVQQQSYTLGVIAAGLSYLGVSQTLNGITEQCEASGYALLLKALPRFDVTNIVPIIESLIAHQVEGIIFAAPELNDNVKLVQAQLPTTCPPMLFLKSRPHPRYTSVSIDNYNGARTLVEYLISLGRRRIGLISGPMDWLESRQRFARLAQSYPQMDAVFACNDQMALGVLHHAYLHGIRVPDELAVVGFDDLSEAAQFSPALTTMRQPLRELGNLTVQTLLAQLEGREVAPAGREIMLQPELVIRASTPTPPLST